MTVPLKRVLARMSPERRARVEAEAKRMIAEELTLRDLRKALKAFSDVADGPKA